ncbi:MAG: hypothetical protein GXO57_07600, partial [Thermodesulfobacteria bacterium]|nr:hypothetical protein [Thermodesulfobacteriota bacterium]
MRNIKNIKLKETKTEIDDKFIWIQKLMDEVKIFWTVHTAVIGILGHIALISFNFKEKFLKCNLILVYFSAYFLIIIGTVYNLVGNYYIFLCKEEIRDKKFIFLYEKQIKEIKEKKEFTKGYENLITPILMIIYTFLGGIVIGIFFHYLFKFEHFFSFLRKE